MLREEALPAGRVRSFTLTFGGQVPIYEYECKSGHPEERFYGMNDRHPLRVRCSVCGKHARRVVSHTNIQPVIHEYLDRGMGKVIKGRTHLREVQKQLGCVDADVKSMQPTTSWNE
jgi:putative FmdB family regulatory protein